MLRMCPHYLTMRRFTRFEFRWVGSKVFELCFHDMVVVASAKLAEQKAIVVSHALWLVKAFQRGCLGFFSVFAVVFFWKRKS